MTIVNYLIIQNSKIQIQTVFFNNKREEEKLLIINRLKHFYFLVNF
jgi:hypothetical protein